MSSHTISILAELQRRKSLGIKSIAILLDPDELDEANIPMMAAEFNRTGVDFIFFGGSLVHSLHGSMYIAALKSHTHIPIILFPGNSSQIEPLADGILLLSLISGRNPELLIGQHVQAAVRLAHSGLEILSTGYMLIESGKATTVSYISNTEPIPNDKPSIAAATALAGQQIGMKLIFMDGGSGALKSVPDEMVSQVAKTIDIPLIIGGGLRSEEKIINVLEAGADLVVVGNVLESNFELLESLVNAAHRNNQAIMS